MTIKTVYGLKFDKMVSYWNPSQGAGVKVDGTSDRGIWHTDISGFNGEIKAEEGKNFSDQLAEYLKNNLDYSDSYLIIMEAGRVVFNMIENNEGYPVSSSAESTEQLYLCDYSVYIEVRQVHEPSAEELAALLPHAESGV